MHVIYFKKLNLLTRYFYNNNLKYLKLMLTKNFKKLIYRFKQPTYKKRLGKTKFYRIYNFHIRKCGGSSMNYGFTSYPNNNKENYYKLATHLKTN